MIKFRLDFDKDRDVKWLNKMSAEGWAMTGFFAGFFTFEKCDKGKWNYQVDFGEKMFAVSDEYREFMEDTGAEIVQTWGYWVFLRKLASLGNFELYTDVDSSIEHYKKIRKMFRVVTFIELIAFYVEVFAAINGAGAGYICAMLIAVTLLAFSGMVIKITKIIDELEERKSGIALRRKRYTVLIPMGMLALSVSFITRGYVPDIITLILQIIAIVLETLGLLTCTNRK